MSIQHWAFEGLHPISRASCCRGSALATAGSGPRVSFLTSRGKLWEDYRQNMFDRPQKKSGANLPVELSCFSASPEMDSKRLCSRASSLRKGFAEWPEVRMLEDMKDQQLLRSSFCPHSGLH